MICFIDYKTSDEEVSRLLKLNLDIIKIPQYTNLYPQIDGHVDIQINILDSKNKKLIINRDIDINFKEKLKKFNISFMESDSFLQYKYPNNIALNAFINENFLVHNLKYTDKNLIDYFKDKKTINVNQGYTKCSILPVRENAIITSDKNIYKNLCEFFDILLIPSGDIVLENLNYGFIGGVGGKIDDNTLAFFGNLNNYKYGDEIKKFLNKYDVKPIYLSNTKLIDRGSLYII